MKILSVGTDFGAGHIAQARALEATAKKRGISAETIDFVRTFGKPKHRRRYESALHQQRKNPGIVSGVKLLAAHEDFYLRGIKKDKVRRFADENKDHAIVLTNPHLQMGVRHVKQPIHVLHTDPKKWTGEYDRSLVSSGRRIHLGTKDVIGALRPREGHVISGLAVHPDVLRKKKRSGLMRRKDHNITVSGGALGMEVLPMTQQVLQAKLPKNAVVHAVAGRDKRLKRRLDTMAKKDPRLRSHGFAPLGAMMQEADLNVIRAHGTTYAETVASGKPAVYYAPNPSLVDYQGQLTKETALHGEQAVKHPSAIGLTKIPDAVNTVLRRPRLQSQRALTAKRRMKDPAGQAVDFIMKSHLRSQRR